MTSPDQRLQDISEAIKEIHFKKDAIEIAQLAAESPLVIVTGPLRNGKSTSLLPLVANNLLEQGFAVTLRDALDPKYLSPGSASDIVRGLPNSTNGVLIIDEAGMISNRGKGYKQVRTLLKNARDKEYGILAVIPYFIGNTPFRDIQADVWQKAGQTLLKISPPTYHMEPIRVRSDLYRELLETRLTLFGIEFPKDQVDFVLTQLPACLEMVGPIVMFLLEAKSQSGTRHLASVLRRNLDRMRNLLTEEEVSQLKERLKEFTC